jgi:predicted enzyme related to lactoylglutathione lyase
MNWTLEVVVVPVSDVDRAKAFYAEQLSFNVDHDTRISDEARIVQLTPPGSGCSIVVGKGIVPDMPPGSLQGLQLVVSNIHKARAQLVERGVEVSEIQILGENPSPTGDVSITSGSSSSAIRTATAGRCSRYLPAAKASDRFLFRRPGPGRRSACWPGSG